MKVKIIKYLLISWFLFLFIIGKFLIKIKQIRQSEIYEFFNRSMKNLVALRLRYSVVAKMIFKIFIIVLTIIYFKIIFFICTKT